MTIFSRLMLFFPALVIGLALACLGWLLVEPGWLPGLALVWVLYAFPLLIFRLHRVFAPSREGVSYLLGGYSAWWGGHQIQWVYIAFPALEILLRLVPGLFSLWLRLWGSRIGRSVYWTPMVEITDRDLIELGDFVVVGHRVGLYSHVIKPKRDDLLLFTRRIRIGSGAFVGAGSRLGPGVRIAAGASINAATDLFPNAVIAVESAGAEPSTDPSVAAPVEGVTLKAEAEQGTPGEAEAGGGA